MHVGVFILRDLSLAGGSLVRIVGITKYLEEMGCKVTLFAPNYTPLLKGKVNYVQIPDNCIRGSKSVEYSAYPFLWPLTILPSDKRLINLIKAHDIDLIHCHQHTSAFRLFKIKNKLKIPIAFEIHGILKLQQSDIKATERKGRLVTSRLLRAERNMFREMNSIFVRTQYEKDYITKEFLIPSSKIFIVPDGADVDFLGKSISEDEREKCFKELNLSPTKKTIFFAGEFKLQSGVTDLLSAFNIVSSRRSDVQLVLIGEGALMNEVKGLVSQYKLANVALPGRVPRDRFKLYQNIADVMVTPEIDSLYNNLGAPLKLFECMASGKPTIATQISSHLTIIKDGYNGYFVHPKDCNSISEGILRVLDSKDSYQVGLKGRETMVESYSWRKFSKDSIAAYSTILSVNKN
jgi:glycosyltransferase involved in cell wall biosynthesis